MGLVMSVWRRIELARGEPLPVAMKIFFASREMRRALEVEKFGKNLKIPNGSAADVIVEEPLDLEREAQLVALAPFVDEAWYSTLHRLNEPAAAVEHYLDTGLRRSWAPCPSLAGDDGTSLTHWGLEYLIRSGVKVGEIGSERLAPDDPRALNPFGIQNQEKKKIAVVTAIFGEFDRLLPADPSWTKNADFFVFTDQLFETHGVWQHVHSNYYNEDPRRRARFVKLHLPTYFSAYDWVFWIDGNILICEDPASVLDHLSPDDFEFATFRHPERKSVISEAAACISFNKEDPKVAADHLREVADHPAFRSPNLFETMVLVLRPTSSAVRSLCARWWRTMMRGSKRDQLSLSLAVSETVGLRLGFVPDDIAMTPFFARARHNQ